MPILAATLTRPGFANLSLEDEGAARRQTQTYGSVSVPDTAGASRRATYARSACYFAAIFRTTPGRAFAVSVPLPRQRTEVRVTLGACVRTW